MRKNGLSSVCLLLPLFACAGESGGSEHDSGFYLDRTKTVNEIRRKNEESLAEYRSKFTWKEYLSLVDELANTARYKVIAGEDFAATPNRDKVAVYFRHDLDIAVFHGVKMSAEEKKRGLRGSYYLLHSADYYGRKTPGKVWRYTAMDPLYQEIYHNGHEVGVHSDLFTLQLTNRIAPLPFQKAELAYYRTIGIPVTGTVCHGSIINSWGLNNTWLFSDFGRKGEYDYNGKTYRYGELSVADFGFSYEGYRLKCPVRLSDISGYDAAELLKRLRACKPGDTVSLLIHPVHWRREE